MSNPSPRRPARATRDCPIIPFVIAAILVTGCESAEGLLAVDSGPGPGSDQRDAGSATADSSPGTGQDQQDAGNTGSVVSDAIVGSDGHVGVGQDAAPSPQDAAISADAGVTPEELQRKDTIDQVIRTAGRLPSPKPREEVQCADGCPAAYQDGSYMCMYHRFRESREFPRAVVLDVDPPELWPGNVLNGARLFEGQLVPVGLELAPVSLSVSLQNIAGSPRGQLPAPSLGAFREEMLKILRAGVKGDSAAVMDYQLEEISSEAQLTRTLGGSLKLPIVASLAVGYDFKNTKNATRILLNFTQAYYSVDVDSRLRPADVVAPTTSAARVSAQVGVGAPPILVRSVTYGRRIFLAIESTESRETVKTAVEAAAKLFKIGGSASVTNEQERILRTAKVRAVVLGGGASSAGAAITEGLDGMKRLITEGARYSETSPGVPIGYRLSYLDNTEAVLVQGLDYVEPTCALGSAVTVKSRVESMTDLTPDIGSGAPEFYGFVEVIVTGKGHDGSCDLPPGSEVDGIALMDYARGMYYRATDMLSGEARNVPFAAGKSICIRVRLQEADPLADDDYGFRALQLPWDKWVGTHTLNLKNDGNEAAVKVSISIE